MSRYRVVVSLYDDEEPDLGRATLIAGYGHFDDREDWPLALGMAVGNFVRIATHADMDQAQIVPPWFGHHE